MPDTNLKIGDRVIIPRKNMAASSFHDEADRAGTLLHGSSWDTRRIRFEDTGDISRSYYTHRFEKLPTDPTFTLDFKTTNVDEAIEAAKILAQSLGKPVGVINA